MNARLQRVNGGKVGVKKEVFGKTKQGNIVTAYTLENKNGLSAKVINYGAILVDLLVPDQEGKVEDVVLGFDSLEGYFENGSFFGATVGPSANRIKNAKFELKGKTVQLAVNDGLNNLHSHFSEGFHKKVWDALEGENSVTFYLESQDGEMGFPGNRKFWVTYTLTDQNELKIEYIGESDCETLMNLTNHTYFRLEGPTGKDIHNDELCILASNYTPVVEGAIPTGEIAPVLGTPMDFTKPKLIGKEINEEFEQLKLVNGYDHNWVVDGYDGNIRLISTLFNEKSGRKMETYSDLPGVQFYAGNMISPVKGKEGMLYSQRMALCLETQFYPDSANRQEFPQPFFGPEKPYKSTTIYKFV